MALPEDRPSSVSDWWLALSSPKASEFPLSVATKERGVTMMKILTLTVMALILASPSVTFAQRYWAGESDDYGFPVEPPPGSELQAESRGSGGSLLGFLFGRRLRTPSNTSSYRSFSFEPSRTGVAPTPAYSQRTQSYHRLSFKKLRMVPRTRHSVTSRIWR